MGKNRKTVFKGFCYTQCDDFARYLESMAAAGWHFKEWSAGLVFEKGAPEQAVYAVDVFIDGLESDLRPAVHTLEFADYCEAAGWKFVDAKQKFCIFKRIREDATDILTPGERLKNAAKAEWKRNIVQLVSMTWLAVFWVIRCLDHTSFINAVFSNTRLFTDIFTLLVVLLILSMSIWRLVWRHRAGKKVAQGQYRILTDNGPRFFAGISMAVMILYFAALCIAKDTQMFVWVLGIVLVMGIVSLIISKIRPDSETYFRIQTGIFVVLFFSMVIFNLVVLTQSDTHETDPDTLPLLYADIEPDAGELDGAVEIGDSSFLGSGYRYTLVYGDEYVFYDVYKTSHVWILDRIWDYESNRANNVDWTDCTAQWGASYAYRNDLGDYYVRFDGAILKFGVNETTYLSQEQIDIICNLLELR